MIKALKHTLVDPTLKINFEEITQLLKTAVDKSPKRLKYMNLGQKYKSLNGNPWSKHGQDAVRKFDGHSSPIDENKIFQLYSEDTAKEQFYEMAKSKLKDL